MSFIVLCNILVLVNRYLIVCANGWSDEFTFIVCLMSWPMEIHVSMFIELYPYEFINFLHVYRAFLLVTPMITYISLYSLLLDPKGGR